MPDRQRRGSGHAVTRPLSVKSKGGSQTHPYLSQVDIQQSRVSDLALRAGIQAMFFYLSGGITRT